MSLHNGIDTVAIATVGVFSKTYGSSSPGNLANLFASLGLIESAVEQIARAAAGMFRLMLGMRMT